MCSLQQMLSKADRSFNATHVENQVGEGTIPNTDWTSDPIRPLIEWTSDPIRQLIILVFFYRKGSIK